MASMVNGVETKMETDDQLKCQSGQDVLETSRTRTCSASIRGCLGVSNIFGNAAGLGDGKETQEQRANY